MRFLSLSLLIVAAATLVPALSAQSFQSEFTLESRLLDRDLELFAQARQRENEAVREFRSLTEQVDAALLDPNAALSTLRDLEARLSAARETAYLRSKETGEARLRIYERMERLVELAQAVERGEASSLTVSDGPSGLWQIDLEPIEAYGLMKLVAEGQLVTGSYRLSNGNHGSMRGTWSGGELKVEVIHADRGRVGQLEGTLDAGRTELSGRWNTMEVANGQPSAGSWVATLVADEVGLDLGQ